MGPKTARVLLRVWGVVVMLLILAGAGAGGWVWWLKHHPQPPESQPMIEGRVCAVKTTDGVTEVLIEGKGGGAIWAAYRGPHTIVRTRSGGMSEIEVNQMVKVWGRTTTDQPGEPHHAVWILIEGYKPKLIQP